MAHASCRISLSASFNRQKGNAMDLQELLAAVNDLPPDERKKLVAHLTEHEGQNPQRGEEWLAKLDSALDKFWDNVSPDEKTAILEAINTKSLPSENEG